MPTNPRAFIDVDIDHHRAKVARAEAFVAACNLRYGLTSNVLAELGGSERSRLPELYANDYEWSGKGPIALEPRPERIVVELWPEKAPLAVESFQNLCTGVKGKGGGGKPLHFFGCPFHRVVPGFIVQGGDILFGNGTGGESALGGGKRTFRDDPGGLKVKLDRRGLLAMGNSGQKAKFRVGRDGQKRRAKRFI